MRSLTFASAVAAVLVMASLVSACAGARPKAAVEPKTPEAAAAKVPDAPHLPELPLGGREIFPTYRLVGFCGTPGALALGQLEGNLPVKAKALEAYAAKYEGGHKVMPVFELIAVVVQAQGGNDGKYRHRVDDSVVDTYLEAARRSKALLLLNIQPGQSDFLTEVKHFEKYLHEPDVGIALDPEWAMRAGQKPGAVYGQTTGAAINQVAEYMAAIVKQGSLPEKALVFHQVSRVVLKDEAAVKSYPGVAVIKSVDGLGPKAAKIATYNNLMEIMTPTVHPGFKLFFDEDRVGGGKVMTPVEVMALTPQPAYIMYE